MNRLHSDFIREIAKSHDLLRGDVTVSDDTFASFSESYMRLSHERDAELARHIAATPHLHRTYTPYTERSLEMALQVHWYFDEVLVRDPIASWLSDTRLAQADKKAGIQAKVIEVLRIEAALEQGAVKLVGPNAAPLKFPSDEAIAADPQIQAFLNDTRVRSSLWKSVRYSAAPLCLPSGAVVGHAFGLSLDVGGVAAVSGSFPTDAQGRIRLPIFFGSSLPEIDRDRFLSMFSAEDELAVEKVFPLAVAAARGSALVAVHLDSSLISDREHVQAVLNASGVGADRQRAVDGFQLALPFIGGADPQRLMEIRKDDPMAFREFRQELVQVIEAARKEVAPECVGRRAEELLQRRCVPSLRLLEREMRAWATRVGVFSFGLPAVGGTGALMGFHYDVPAAAIGAIVATGTAAVVAGSSLLADRAKLKSNSFHFLWRARRSRG